MKARRTRKRANKALLSLLLAAVMVAEPAASSAVVYAAESVNEQTVDLAEDVSENVENDQDISDETEKEQGSSDVIGEEQDGSKEDGSDETGGEQDGSKEDSSDETGGEQNGSEEDSSDENSSDENGSEETGDNEDSSNEENADETEDETDNSEEENLEEDLEEEDILEEESVEDENDWEGTGHKAPQLEMSLTSAMVAEKEELSGTAERLERLSKNVQYVPNEAVFLAPSKSYANQVAQGYGAILESYEDGVAVMAFADDVVDIITMAEDEKVKLPAVYPNFIYTTCNDVVTVSSEMTLIGEDNAAMAQDVLLNPASQGYQYYHDEINSSKAWEYNNAAGRDIKVAVIDSGINKSHEDLNGRVASASTTSSAPYNKAEDNNGHGTHVSGIIAANKDNGPGGAGIAYNSKIVSIKALENNPATNDASGYTSDIIKALNSAVKSGARVINMSLGGYGYDGLYEATVDTAINKGIVVVVAAGNETNQLSKDKNSAYYCSPACFDNVITVSAKQKGENTLAEFSNYGAGIIDITAPGVNIASTVPGDYAWMSGTSQATPMVAAAAAYILSVSPDLKKNKTKTAVDTVKKILQDSATSLGDSANFGAGLLNVEAAIKMAAPVSGDKGGIGELQAPTVKIQGRTEALKANDTIQDTDFIELSSTLGAAPNNEIKIYYTTDGKAPTEKSTLYEGAFKLETSGNKTIKAVAVYYGKKSAVTTIKVKVNAYVQSFNIVSKTGSVYLGAGKSLALATDAKSFTPAYATNKKVEWTVIGDGATINASGKLTATGNIDTMKTVTVQATAVDRKTDAPESAAKATMSITLIPLVSSIALNADNPASVELNYEAGKAAPTYQMKVDILPAEANAAISYTSSNAKIATVNSSGEITAVGNGTATITAKATDGSNKKVTMRVKVTKQIQSVEVTSKTGEYQVAAGKSLQMVANVTGDATNKKVTWEIISGTEFADINNNGKLTAKSVTGVQQVQVKATAQDDGKQSDTKTIQIYQSVTGKIALEEGTSGNLGTTEKGDLKETIQLHPYTENYLTGFFGRAKGSGATGLGNFTYTSSNTKIATVSETGLVTVNEEGKTGTTKIKVTARDGSGKTAVYTVKVVKPVTSIVIYSKTGSVVVGKGKKISLGASVGGNASNKKLKWTSSNTSVATVDNSGKVKGVSYDSTALESEVTITAEATDGSGVYATYTVWVQPAITKLMYRYRTIFGQTGWSASVVDTTELSAAPKKTIYEDTYAYLNYLLINQAPYYFDETSGKEPRYIYEDGEQYLYWDWSSVSCTCSNSNVIQIATVEVAEGQYQQFWIPVNKGKATLTFKALDGSGKSAKLTITVR